jgi:hypothetical protein
LADDGDNPKSWLAKSTLSLERQMAFWKKPTELSDGFYQAAGIPQYEPSQPVMVKIENAFDLDQCFEPKGDRRQTTTGETYPVVVYGSIVRP